MSRDPFDALYGPRHPGVPARRVLREAPPTRTTMLAADSLTREDWWPFAGDGMCSLPGRRRPGLRRGS